jgi:hypothetical protein
MRYFVGFVLLLLALGTLGLVGCGEASESGDCTGQGRGKCHTSVWDPKWGCHEPDGTGCCVERDCCDPWCRENRGELFCVFCQLCCLERGECIGGSCR